MIRKRQIVAHEVHPLNKIKFGHDLAEQVSSKGKLLAPLDKKRTQIDAVLTSSH